VSVTDPKVRAIRVPAQRSRLCRGTSFVQTAAVVNDCAAAGGILSRPAWLGLCLPDVLNANTSIGGAYQVDDPVPSGVGCRSPNRLTGSCSCPPGFSAQEFRAMAPVGFPPDGETPFIGSNVFICGGSSSAGAFQGAFQLDDPVPNSLGCRVPNPSTGSCSCPTGSTQQKMRVLADNAGESFGSNIAVCVNAPPPSPDMMTICSGVTADKWVSRRIPAWCTALCRSTSSLSQRTLCIAALGKQTRPVQSTHVLQQHHHISRFPRARISSHPLPLTSPSRDLR